MLTHDVQRLMTALVYCRRKGTGSRKSSKGKSLGHRTNLVPWVVFARSSYENSERAGRRFKSNTDLSVCAA